MIQKLKICHQKPERSFHFNKKQFPLCSRCTGFYFTIITFTYLFLFMNFQSNLFFTIFAYLLIVPMGIDGTTQYLKLRESTNFLRLITGILAGIGISILIIAIINKISINIILNY